MICENCKAVVYDSWNLCSSCRLKYKTGKCSVVPVKVTQAVPIIPTTQTIVSTLQVSEETLNQQIKETEVSISNFRSSPKIDISTLFVDPATANTQKFFKPAVNLSDSLEMVVRETESSRHNNHKPETTRKIDPINQDRVEIYRPQDILKLSLDNKPPIPLSELAAIEVKYSNTIDNVLKQIEEQGPITYPQSHENAGQVEKTVPERKLEYLKTRIEDFDKEIARLKAAKSVYSKKDTQLKNNIVETMTPEEIEDFKRRARKAASEPDKYAKKAKEDALKAIKKEKRAAAKMLQDFGAAGIAFVTSTYKLTTEECKKFLETGDF